jgi:hypothetical protein
VRRIGRAPGASESPCASDILCAPLLCETGVRDRLEPPHVLFPAHHAPPDALRLRKRQAWRRSKAPKVLTHNTVGCVYAGSGLPRAWGERKL